MTVKIGDWRRISDGREGVITEIDGNTATLLMNLGGYEESHVDDLTLNDWEKPAPAPEESIEDVADRLQRLTDAVDQMILDSLMGGM